MPVAPPAKQPSTPPAVLMPAERNTLTIAAIARINQAFTAFTSACAAHVASIKAEDKAQAEILAAAVDIFFGFAAPVFSQHLMAHGRTKLAKKFAETLSRKTNDATVKAISESDFLKEGFKAVGKIATTKIKLNPAALFGEDDVQLFARQLKDQFHAGVQALTDDLAANKFTDKELIATWAAYQVEYTTESAYVEALKKTFEEFKTYVRPIGVRSHTGRGAFTAKTRGIWLRTLTGTRLALVTEWKGAWHPKGLQFQAFVPQQMESFVIAKTLREFGTVETVDDYMTSLIRPSRLAPMEVRDAGAQAVKHGTQRAAEEVRRTSEQIQAALRAHEEEERRRMIEFLKQNPEWLSVFRRHPQGPGARSPP